MCKWRKQLKLILCWNHLCNTKNGGQTQNEKFMLLPHRSLSHKNHPTAILIILVKQLQKRQLFSWFPSWLILINYHSLCKPHLFYPCSVPQSFPITLMRVCKLKQKIKSVICFTTSMLQPLSSNSVPKIHMLPREIHYFVIITLVSSFCEKIQ